jgi:hypothetical protein
MSDKIYLSKKPIHRGLTFKLGFYSVRSTPEYFSSACDRIEVDLGLVRRKCFRHTYTTDRDVCPLSNAIAALENFGNANLAYNLYDIAGLGTASRYRAGRAGTGNAEDVTRTKTGF